MDFQVRLYIQQWTSELKMLMLLLNQWDVTWVSRMLITWAFSVTERSLSALRLMQLKGREYVRVRESVSWGFWESCYIYSWKETHCLVKARNLAHKTNLTKLSWLAFFFLLLKKHNTIFSLMLDSWLASTPSRFKTQCNN